jgi:uncharacterized surface protein with fasciclin (FAS1) repeats/tetratricopeptide (TPR) repeat protein
MYLCGVMICFMAACSDNEDGQPKPQEQPKETPEVITEVVETLEETVPQASNFVEVLKKADLTGVTAEKITVFAVRNELTNTRAKAGLDTVSVKRHIVVGTHRKEELVDGQELTSVSGEQLLVSKAGDEISINGVVVTGEPVQAGDSYIYVVPKVIPARESASSEPVLHHTTLYVSELTGNDYGTISPLEGVVVKALNSSRDSLNRYITDASGEIKISHASDTIFYQLYKAGYQTYVDWNFDGKIDENEQIPEGGLNMVVYTTDGNKTVSCFMKKENDTEVTLVEAKKQWQSCMNNFYNQNRVLNQKLCYGFGNFSYRNDIDSCSYEYWRMAYKAIDLGVRLQKNGVNVDSSWKDFSNSMQIDMSLIYADILGFYSKVMMWDAGGERFVSDTNVLIQSLDKVAQELPEQQKGAAYAIAARVYLNLKDYQKAYEYCKRVTEMEQYALVPNENVFADLTNKSIIWSGYIDEDQALRKGTYYHPIRYQEVLLMQAETANELGNIAEAIAPLNQIMRTEGKVDIAPAGSTKEDIRGYIDKIFIGYLAKEGLEYSTWRRWGVLDAKIGNNLGYQSPKNSLLPIPKAVVMQYPEMTQNPGYY